MIHIGFHRGQLLPFRHAVDYRKVFARYGLLKRLAYQYIKEVTVPIGKDVRDCILLRNVMSQCWALGHNIWGTSLVCSSLIGSGKWTVGAVGHTVTERTAPLKILNGFYLQIGSRVEAVCAVLVQPMRLLHHQNRIALFIVIHPARLLHVVVVEQFSFGIVHRQ